MISAKGGRDSVPYITLSSPDYPYLLAQLADAPEKIFYRGKPLSELSPYRVAVVGSRDASPYGCFFARKLGSALTRNGISVCSGLAKGIDAAAHQGALEELAFSSDNQCFPVAVLGHGWNYGYPAANHLLRRQLEEIGLVLTEYPPEQPPARWTFPGRNRIIAGLCQGVVVVEAGAKSGALHTARFAYEAGREVWVVPQRPGTVNSVGVLRLLQDGATPIIDIDDFMVRLVDELRISYPGPNCFKPPLTACAKGEQLLPAMERLLAILSLDSGCLPEDLANSMACSLAEVVALLTELEIMGRLERRFDGYWIIR